MNNVNLLVVSQLHKKSIPTIGYIGNMPEIVALPSGYNLCLDDLEKNVMDVEALKSVIENYGLESGRCFDQEFDTLKFSDTIINSYKEWIK